MEIAMARARYLVQECVVEASGEISSFELPQTRLQKTSLLVVGMSCGYLLPVLASRVIVQTLGFSSINFSQWTAGIAFISYALYVPIVWIAWRKRYLALGIVISALLHAMIFGVMFLMWRLSVLR